MKKYLDYAAAGAAVCALAGGIALTATSAAYAGSHGVTPPCIKLAKMPSDRAQASQLRVVFGRLGPLSGYCGLPK